MIMLYKVIRMNSFKNLNYRGIVIIGDELLMDNKSDFSANAVAMRTINSKRTLGATMKLDRGKSIVGPLPGLFKVRSTAIDKFKEKTNEAKNKF